ncbi:MAG TPA: TlpA disulfide reductase family protein [Actinomycetota bacterium]
MAYHRAKDEAKRERRAAAKAERGRRARRSRAARRMWGTALALAVGVAAALLGFALIGDLRPSGVSFAGNLRAGGTLEELRLPELEGDGVVDYASYSDRPLVINFFASWCPNCIAEMPDFERVHVALGGDVAFLGVSQSDPRNASIDLAHQTGITYDTAIDERGEFFRAVGGLGMPTTIFVRPGGEIADVWVGGLNGAALQDLIEEHFGIAI